MKKDIYLIKRLWVDYLENNDPYGYKTVGYVETEQDAKEICGKGRFFDAADFWYFAVNMPEYEYEAIPKIERETQWEVGDIVSRTGSDEQRILYINNEYGTIDVEVIKPDEVFDEEEDHPVFKVGDKESNLIRRYSFVRKGK